MWGKLIWFCMNWFYYSTKKSRMIRKLSWKFFHNLFRKFEFDLTHPFSTNLNLKRWHFKMKFSWHFPNSIKWKSSIKNAWFERELQKILIEFMMQLGIDACALVLENFHLTHSGIGGTNRKIKTKRNNTWSQAGKSMCIFKQKKKLNTSWIRRDF